MAKGRSMANQPMLIDLQVDDDLQFYILFNSFSVISGQWMDDNERLYTLEPLLRFRRFRLERGLNLGP